MEDPFWANFDSIPADLQRWILADLTIDKLYYWSKRRDSVKTIYIEWCHEVHVRLFGAAAVAFPLQVLFAQRTFIRVIFTEWDHPIFGNLEAQGEEHVGAHDLGWGPVPTPRFSISADGVVSYMDAFYPPSPGFVWSSPVDAPLGRTRHVHMLLQSEYGGVKIRVDREHGANPNIINIKLSFINVAAGPAIVGAALYLLSSIQPHWAAFSPMLSRAHVRFSLAILGPQQGQGVLQRLPRETRRGLDLLILRLSEFMPFVASFNGVDPLYANGDEVLW